MMDTLSRLNALVGRKGILKIANNGHAGFTFLSVDPAPDLPAEADAETFNHAISISSFRVRFDDIVLNGGKNEMIILGEHIACTF
jgi:hypothetical protein